MLNLNTNITTTTKTLNEVAVCDALCEVVRDMETYDLMREQAAAVKTQRDLELFLAHAAAMTEGVDPYDWRLNTGCTATLKISHFQVLLKDTYEYLDTLGDEVAIDTVNKFDPETYDEVQALIAHVNEMRKG